MTLRKTLLNYILATSLATIALLLIVASPSKTLTPVPDVARVGFDHISANSMRTLLTFLASDELEGRNTGDRGSKVAARFLETQYSLAGLTPVPGQTSMLQRFSVNSSQIGTDSKIQITQDGASRTASYLRDFLVNSRHTQAVNIVAPLLFAGFGLKNEESGYDDFADVRPAGSVLLILDGKPNEEVSRRLNRALRNEKAEMAKDLGAAAILFISKTLDENFLRRARRRAKSTRLSLADTPDGLPQMVVREDMANDLLAPASWTVDSLRSLISRSSRPHSFTIDAEITIQIDATSEEKMAQNVVAFLEGSDPELKEQVVVIGAHYDHLGKNIEGEVFNGADDDGSGTVGILEVARAFAANPARPLRSLLFVSHSGEERGLLGSRYYTDNPLISAENMVVQLNLDMIGRNEPNSVYVIGSNYISKELHEINEAANKMVALNLDYKYNDLDDPNRFYYRSDHYNYAKHGIPIAFYFAGTHEDYHRTTDTVDKIDFDKMTKVAKLVYLTAWEVANLDHPLRKDGILKDTDL